VQGCKKFTQSWNEQFKLAPPHTHVMTACLEVVRYSPVHSNRMHGPGADKAVKDLRNVVCMHTHIHTHTHILNKYIGTTHFISGIKQILHYAYEKIMYKIMHYKCHINVKHQ
jgi:hypothetical protein